VVEAEVLGVQQALLEPNKIRQQSYTQLLILLAAPVATVAALALALEVPVVVPLAARLVLAREAALTPEQLARKAALVVEARMERRQQRAQVTLL